MFEKIKYNLLNNWNATRFIRLVLSVFVIVESIRSHEILIGMLGGVLLYQALANAGCCNVNRFSTSQQNANKLSEEVEFTEIK